MKYVYKRVTVIDEKGYMNYIRAGYFNVFPVYLNQWDTIIARMENPRNVEYYKNSVENKYGYANALYYRRKKPDICYNVLLECVKVGYAPAECLIGRVLYNGFGTSVDYKNAYYFINTSYEKGYKIAAYCLGIMYYDGKAVKADDSKAYKYVYEAHEAGYTLATARMGAAYARGVFGLKKDMSKALSYFNEASNFDEPTAYYSLGFVYYKGDGVAVDKKKAYDYFVRAAACGDTKSMLNCANMLSDGDGIEEDESLAYHYYKEAAEAGDVNGMYLTGVSLIVGYGTYIPNMAQGIEWLKKGAALGDQDCKDKLKEYKVKF